MSMLFHNRFLTGAIGFLPLFDGEGGGGGGAAPGGAPPAGGAAPGGGAPPAGGAAPPVKDPAGGAAPPAGGAAPPAGGAAPKPPGTIAGGVAEPPKVAATATWPDNWRAEMAGDDKAYLKVLERYDSPAAVAKAHRELSTKMSAGELKAPAKPLAADATPEQKLAWRKENGLPEAAEGFVGALKLPGGLVPGENDKPLLNEFAKAAFDAGVDQKTFDFAANWYFQQQHALNAARERNDGTFKNQSLVELSQEWGKDFEGNNNAVSSVIAMLPEAIRDNLLTARLPNGNLVGNDPNFNRAMLMFAKELNPASTILPLNNNGGGLASVEAQLAAHDKNMKSEPGSDAWKAYWQNDKAQQEYRELLGARQTMQSRQKVA